MPTKNTPPCQVCGKPSVAKKMCDKHYRRWKKYGNSNATKRPDDWGKKHKHPLWHTWKWTARVVAGRVQRWDDFWVFVDDVGRRPAETSRLKRYKIDMPFGPDNCFWSDPVVDAPGQTTTREGKAKYMRDWRLSNPVRTKHYDIKKRFGLGADEYMTLLKRQGGKCAICGGEDEWFSLAVDHCHDKKHIRGLLCSQCNRGLGLFRENPEWLRKAAEYIEGTKRLL